MNEWQPIRTAPKDGRQILVARQVSKAHGWIVAAAWWDDGSDYDESGERPEDVGWWALIMSRYSGDTERDELTFKPTRWCSLPTIPASVKKVK